MSEDPGDRSFWGWGRADRFPAVDARRALGEHVATALGVSGVRVDEPVRLEDVEVPPPRVELPSTLDSVVTSDRAQRIRHTYGRAYRDLIRGFRGDFGGAPDLVAHPADEADIARILDWAASARVAVVPYGGGTSVVGGVEPIVPPGYAGTLSLDMERLGRVLEVDRTSQCARIQAGAKGPALEAALSAHGLTLRHYPQSFELSTLGGWIATRAAGHFATLLTHIDDLVESTRMLTPRGVLETRRVPGSGAGPSPDRLVLGSEGALGVITEAWMRVRPRPAFRSSASVRFASFESAVTAVRAIAQSGLYPANCRLLDPAEAALTMVANDGSAVLILAFESADHPLEPWIARALELCADHGGACPGGPKHRSATNEGRDDAADHWKQVFLEAPYLLNTLVSAGLIADTFETAITWDRFHEMHAAVTTAVRDVQTRVAGSGALTCRFTHIYPDGPAPYYTFLAPGRRGSELEQHAEMKRAASEALLAAGATITHHHAIGRVHRPWYDRQRPALFGEALTAAKARLDPAGIMNPGCLLDAAPAPA